MTQQNKMQIRAEVFSTINSIFSNEDSNKNVIANAVEKIKKIDDKDFLSKLLLKEFISTNEEEKSALISILLTNCVPIDILENNLWSNLALKNVSDKKKYQLIEILKMMGKFIEYDKYLDYFEDPQLVIDIDTHKILDTAMYNPEAQIDFLDFISTLTLQDKMLLITSISEDYEPNDLANILAPLVLFEKENELLTFVIDLLVKSKSYLAYYPILHLAEMTIDKDIKKLTQKAIKELKIAGVTDEKTKEFYKKEFFDSISYKCYTSLIDGKGNQGLLFSRIRRDDTIQMFCVVINDVFGVTDCFGFNSLSQAEFTLMLEKFFNNEKTISLTFETGKSFLNEAEKTTFINNNTLPYEYACWREILFDIDINETPFDKIIKTSLSMLPEVPFSLNEIFEKEYLDKLYFEKDDNMNFEKFIEEIDEILSKNIDLEIVEKKIKENIFNIIDETIKIKMIDRIQKIAFCLMSNSDLKDASRLFCLTKNDEKLEQYYEEVIKKSVFEFYRLEYIASLNKNSDNIFLKSNQTKTKLNNAQTSNVLKLMLENWGEDA